MEDKTGLVETLVHRTAEYGKTSYALIKLKALERTSDVVSTFVPYALLLLLFSAFLLFLSFGLASWLGELMGYAYLGMFAVALIYGVIGVAMHFLLHRWLKSLVSDYIINLVLKS